MASMLEFFIYFGILVGVFIAGILSSFLFYFLYDKYKIWKLKKTIPKTQEGKLDLDAMKIMPKPEINERGQKENERKEFEKFREFERLRSTAARDSTSNSSDNRDGARIDVSPRDDTNEGRYSVQDANVDG